jgi:hypothetical protein
MWAFAVTWTWTAPSEKENSAVYAAIDPGNRKRWLWESTSVVLAFTRHVLEKALRMGELILVARI